MAARKLVVISLLAGVATATLALLALLALVAFLPGPVRPLGPAPSAVPSVIPSPTSAGASPAATPSPSAVSSAAPVASAIGSPSGAPFGVGLPAPALRVPGLGGGTIDLAELRGKPVWIDFMQTSCALCRDEFPVMNGFAVRYADRGLVVLAVDIREDRATVTAFRDALHVTFPIGLDVDGVAQRAWGAIDLPVHLWVDRDGIVRAGALGDIGPDAMARNLGTILPGATVTP
jgi:thiol-disulfide isomerase/thioredoxin